MLLCGIFFTVGLFAQQPHLVRAIASYDTTAVAELFNTTPIGLHLIYSDSVSNQTAGFLKGNVRWNKLTVTSSNGTVQNGVLQFNRPQLIKDNYRITLTVTTKDKETVQTVLTLPRVVGVRFNLYSDSIKRGVHYYLNVEGQFSSHKVFPLDTSVLRFATSDGQIIGQDLLLPKQDTIKSVIIEAWYKPNPDYYLRTVVPVKQAPDNASLLTDPNQLFQKKKRN